MVITMKILGVDHFQFIVKDFEESVEFFKKIGFELERTTDEQEEKSNFTKRLKPGRL